MGNLDAVQLNFLDALGNAVAEKVAARVEEVVAQALATRAQDNLTIGEAPLLTDTEVAARLGITRGGWYNYWQRVKDGTAEAPPHLMLSGRRLYEWSKVEAWMRPRAPFRRMPRKHAAGR